MDGRQRVILREQELDVVISACHWSDPLVIVVDPAVIAFDPYDSSVFVERRFGHDGTREPRATFLRTIFETCWHVFAAMHLAISYYGREVLAHEAIEVRVVGISVRSEEARIVAVFVEQGFLGHTFLHDLCDVVEQPFAKRRILFGLVAHLLWRGRAFYPELWTNVRACISGRGKYRHVNVRGVSSLILYRAEVVCQLAKNSSLQHLLDDGRDHAVEVLHHSEGIAEHPPQPVLGAVQLRVEAFDVDLLPRVEQRDWRVAFGRVESEEDDGATVVYHRTLELRQQIRLLLVRAGGRRPDPCDHLQQLFDAGIRDGMMPLGLVCGLEEVVHLKRVQQLLRGRLS